MRGWAVAGDVHRVDVPHPREVLDVGVVGPIPETRQVPVGAGLTGVLRSGLPVHLQDAAAGFAEHASQDVDVDDLYGGCGGLMGLVEP